MLREVVQHGTAVAAAKMPYALAGKTGTTNDFTDAWFIGFSPSITAASGSATTRRNRSAPQETGGRAALPIWMEFMKAALAGKDSGQFEAPPFALPPVAQKVDTPDVAPGDGESH